MDVRYIDYRRTSYVDDHYAIRNAPLSLRTLDIKVSLSLEHQRRTLARRATEYRNEMRVGERNIHVERVQRWDLEDDAARLHVQRCGLDGLVRLSSIYQYEGRTKRSRELTSFGTCTVTLIRSPSFAHSNLGRPFCSVLVALFCDTSRCAGDCISWTSGAEVFKILLGEATAATFAGLAELSDTGCDSTSSINFLPLASVRRGCASGNNTRGTSVLRGRSLPFDAILGVPSCLDRTRECCASIRCKPSSVVPC